MLPLAPFLLMFMRGVAAPELIWWCMGVELDERGLGVAAGLLTVIYLAWTLLAA